MKTAIEVHEISKSYHKHQPVLEHCSFSVPEHCVYGLLGHNGAGKSTLLKMLAGLLARDAGDIRVAGFDPEREPVELKKVIGYVGEAQKIFDYYTLEEYGRFLSNFYPGWNCAAFHDFAKRFHLPLDRKIKTFSRGMYTLAMLSGVLCRPCEVLLLDEPVLGLDVSARREFQEALVLALEEFPHTVILSSHLVNELELLVDRVGFLKDGKIAMQLEMEALRAGIVTVTLPATVTAALPGEFFRRAADGAQVEVFSCAAGDEVAAFCRNEGLPEVPIATRNPGLEELFSL